MFEKINDYTYAISDGSSVGNVGLINTPTGNYQIDTSMHPKTGFKLLKAGQKVGTGKLLGVIVTHYHADHTFGLVAFDGQEVYSHKFSNDNLMKSKESQWTDDGIKEYLDSLDDETKELFEGFRFVFPNKIIEGEGQELEGGVKLYHMGGHTKGSMIATYKDTVFAGDLIFAGTYFWGGDATANPYDWIKALEYIIFLEPKVIVPGHGPVQYDLKEVEKHKQYIEEVIKQGEKMAAEKIPMEKAVEELEKIDYCEENSERRKPLTLEQFYKQIHKRMGLELPS